MLALAEIPKFLRRSSDLLPNWDWREKGIGEAGGLTDGKVHTTLLMICRPALVNSAASGPNGQ
jgi:hypothetical protein